MNGNLLNQGWAQDFKDFTRMNLVRTDKQWDISPASSYKYSSREFIPHKLWTADIRPTIDEEPFVDGECYLTTLGIVIKGIVYGSMIAHCTTNVVHQNLRNILYEFSVSKCRGECQRYICQSFKGKTQSLVTKKTDISYVRSSRNSNLMNTLLMTFGQNISSLVLHLDDGIHCISKFPSIYIQLFWNTLTHDAKTGRSLLHDNIIPKPDLALELGKSISLTEAEEEAVAREVHATHARIMSGPDPEPMQEDQTGSNSGKLHVSLAGPNPEHMDDEFLATAYPKVHENLKLITDERVIEENPESHSGSMSSMKNLDDTYNFGDQFLYDKLTEDDQEKSKVIEESDSTIPDPSHQTVTSTPPVIAPFTDVSSTKPSSLVTPPPINTEATTIITSLPEITPFISLQLRMADH
ncbi:hypothetical protein Tco_0955966 [Tanacetum coccineum]|uniref:Uncharacterized protein n=1 Tax=Tanacetum coccineum TaxID=301880 RepID=A0ABQ5E8M3_9ASTR